MSNRSLVLARRPGVSLLVGLGVLLVGCVETTTRTPSPRRAPIVTTTPSPSPARPREHPQLLVDEPGLDLPLGNRKVTLHLEEVALGELLRELARSLDLQVLLDEEAVAGSMVTLRARDLTLRGLLDQLEALFPIRIQRERTFLRVERGEGPRLSLLVYPLPAGLVHTEEPLDFDSIRQLSFISRSQQEGSGDDLPDPTVGDVADGVDPPTHLEAFLGRIPELLPWPEGSTWHLDRRRNLLFVRSDRETLRQAEVCLDRLVREPLLIEIETRFLEVSEGFARDLGVELGLTEIFPLRQEGGEAKVGIGEDTSTRFGIPPGLPGEAVGLTFSILGVLSEPQFEAVLRAAQSDREAEVLSAPAVSTVNNARATIAVTTNLPYVEDYRPVFDTTVVSSDGISTSDANVALVAVINDRNFTGIVLNVTPSVGSDREHIQLRLQPVVRDQVDSISISSGALVEGVETPAIARPIIETRFIDTQMSLPNRATVALGGLKTTTERTEVRQVPVLGSIPILGWLFRRETIVRERRDLIILVTARVVEGAGSAP